MTKPAALLPLFLVLAACEAIPSLTVPSPGELDLWADASTGISAPELAELAADVWEAKLRSDPFRATYLGDPRYLGEVPDVSLEGRFARKRELQAFQERLRLARLAPLGAEDALTAGLLASELAAEIARLDLALEEWNVDPLEGPHLAILNLAAVQPHATARQRAQLVERWESFPGFVRDVARNLERGRLQRRVAARPAVTKVILQLDAVLAQPPALSPLVTVASGAGRWLPFPPNGNLAAFAHEHLGDAREQGVLLRLNPHASDPKRIANGTYLYLPDPGDPLSIDERAAFVNAVFLAVEEELYPALAALRTQLEKKILPDARDDEHPGLVHLPGGAQAYRTLIHEQTSLPYEECDAKAIHEYGLAEVARIRAEIAQLGAKVLGTSDVARIQQKLRSDPAMHFRTRDEVVAKAREALARAEARVPAWFGRLPESRCEVVPVPAFEEETATIAYYREPAPDGSRPGRYFVNTFAADTRPRYEAEVLAFHEAVPGHHTQIALAQELESLPRFRRHLGSTAFVEGWALYTERLCDEMGLYSGDLDRLGMLSYDAWRAARLVVDTGIHALGWSRDEALDYLYANTLLALNNVETEVDRYIAWPAQALAYKLGQREILALRDQARAALGPAFRYPEFHDRVLGNGAVTLECLRGVIGSWLGTGTGEEEPAEVPVVEASSGR